VLRKKTSCREAGGVGESAGLRSRVALLDKPAAFSDPEKRQIGRIAEYSRRCGQPLPL